MKQSHPNPHHRVIRLWPMQLISFYQMAETLSFLAYPEYYTQYFQLLFFSQYTALGFTLYFLNTSLSIFFNLCFNQYDNLLLIYFVFLRLIS